MRPRHVAVVAGLALVVAAIATQVSNVAQKDRADARPESQVASKNATKSASTEATKQRSKDRALRRALHRLVNDPVGPPGAFVLVQKGSPVRTYRAGVADTDSRTPLTRRMHMRVASTTKAYTGGVALRLADKGVLSLNDRVGKYLPWTPRPWHRVTVRQALHHTSGLPDFSQDDDFGDYLVDHLREAPPPRRLLGFVADKGTQFAPGTRYRYSNTDNVVVALMVEAATGRSYERVLSNQVLEPLGLRDTSLPHGVRLHRPQMHGYDRDDDGSLVDVTKLIAAGYAWASGGIVSTPADQNRFIRGYVGQRLFGARLQRQQFGFRSGDSEPPGPGWNDAGLAIFRYWTPCGIVYGHTGNTPGYTQFMAASANGRRSVVVSINRQTNATVEPQTFRKLRRVFQHAVCTALAH